MSSGFISEAEAAEVRKRRQEEWEKVRTASDPIERPEQPYDNRSLFERLQEQKQKKDLEYEEAHKLKNMIKGLDDDEIEFLDLVDRTKLAADRKKEIEEEQELRDYRSRVAILQEKSIEDHLQAEIVVNKPKVTSGGKLNQQKLLKGIVVKKAQTTKRKMESTNGTNGQDSGDKPNGEIRTKQPRMSSENVQDQGDQNVEGDTSVIASRETQRIVNPSALKCVAILPGLGPYTDSSSDENSSDSDLSEIESKPLKDLLGRKIEIVYKNAEQQHTQK